MSSDPGLSTTTATSSEFFEAAKPSFYRGAVQRAFADMTRGHLRMELPDGTVHEIGSHASALAQRLPLGLPPEAHMRIRREAFFKKCVFAGDIGFAESYLDGDWDTPNLSAVIAWFILNVDAAPTMSSAKRKPIRMWALNGLRFANRLGQWARPNSRTTARRNIAEHYDLSNDFFALMLDPSMMYSSARWPVQAPDLSLEDAQRDKNEALCRRLQLKSTDHVLEIGSGWGGWAIHAAQTHGCRVTSVTISRQQYDFARRRVEAAGLSGRVEIQLQDYRDLTGQYDKIVSIEMMEALGHDYQAEFAEVVARLLKPEGLLALQFITCPDARYAQFRSGVDFIQKHIFPGSLLLSLNRVNELLANAGGFVLHEMEDLGHDYARTLALWRDKFRQRLDDVRALGFDERFIRKWTYYLHYCEAAFAMRNISVIHVVHTRPNNLSLA
jgi:cyclopropane-fatty-acyl-phospholipid synthase